jgi:hypothetical protein
MLSASQDYDKLHAVRTLSTLYLDPCRLERQNCPFEAWPRVQSRAVLVSVSGVSFRAVNHVASFEQRGASARISWP